ncbi:MAG: CRISPR-associated endoribonuclease Cas6 [Bacillus sp. (in: Bacteria)]|nr:CRISPR-associated endoribonuclease Cas6 [Bacillus sp. (in: firmicutes)]
MRFSVAYKVKKLPIGFRMLVLSLVKEALKRSNENYYTSLFIEKKNAMKPFSSAVFLKDYSIENDEIQLEEMTITFSSHDMEFMIYLFNGLQQIKEYHVGKETWFFTSIRMHKEATISSNSVFFRTLSPILIESKEGKPVQPMDSNYEKDFNFYASLRIKELSGRNPHQKIGIKPISFTKKRYQRN